MKRKLKNRARRQAIKMTQGRPGVRRLKNELLEDAAQIIIVPEDGSEPIIVTADELLADPSVETITEDDPALADGALEYAAEIILMGDIGCEWNTNEAVSAALSWVEEGEPVLVSINSDGGDLFEAVGIYNTLLAHTGPVTVRITGRACSAASLIAMAGDRIIMPENSMMMIHQVFNEMFGDAEELREAADMMDAMSGSVVAAYVEKSGLPEDEVLAMMDAETWMSAEEAVSLGFADEVETPIRMTMVSHSKLSGKFRNAPPKMNARKPGAARLRAGKVTARSQKVAARMQSPSGKKAPVARASNALAIAGLCRAAGAPHLTNEYIESGLGLEDVRKKLLTARRSDAKSVNTRSPANKVRPVNSGDIYAKRRAAGKK